MGLAGGISGANVASGVFVALASPIFKMPWLEAKSKAMAANKHTTPMPPNAKRSMLLRGAPTGWGCAMGGAGGT